MRTRPDRHAMLAGLAASVLVHLLLAWLNPVLRPGQFPAGAEPRPTVDTRQLIATPVPTADDVESSIASTTPSPRAVAPPDPDAPAAATPARGAGRTPDRAEPRVADRLRYRPGPIWAPFDSVRETREECLQRRVTERLAAGIADPTYGISGPPVGIVQPRGPDVGIRIPFGRKRPPPAVRVPPAPIPDSLRTDLADGGAADTATSHRPRILLGPECLDSVPGLVPRLRPDTAS